MYLLFDVGGTKTRFGFSKDGNEITDFKIIPTPAEFDTFVSQLKEISADLGQGEEIKAVAGGLTGVLNSGKSALVRSPNLVSWIDKPVSETLQQTFNAPVFLENDTTLNGLGEAIFGAGKGKNIVAYITVSTGIGGTRIVNGNVDVKAIGFEPGHQVISPDGLELENWISGKALEKEHGLAAENIEDPAVWDESAKRLSLGLANTIVHWSPEILILGGGLMNKISPEAVKKYLPIYLKIFPSLPEIVKAELGELSGLHGALRYIKYQSAPTA